SEIYSGDVAISGACQGFCSYIYDTASASRPPPTYPPGGEIWSPVLKPGGQFSVRAPHSCTIGLLGMAKLEIQTLSFPSTATAHGPGRPPPLNGEPGKGVPSGFSSV